MYYSDNNGTTWYPETETQVIDNNGTPSVTLTTTHFADFAVTTMATDLVAPTITLI